MVIGYNESQNYSIAIAICILQALSINMAKQWTY